MHLSFIRYVRMHSPSSAFAPSISSPKWKKTQKLKWTAKQRNKTMWLKKKRIHFYSVFRSFVAAAFLIFIPFRFWLRAHTHTRTHHFDCSKEPETGSGEMHNRAETFSFYLILFCCLEGDDNDKSVASKIAMTYKNKIYESARGKRAIARKSGDTIFETVHAGHMVGKRVS